MPVLLACPTCLQKVRAPDSVLGKQIKCPQCKNPFLATDSSAPPAPLPRTPSQRETTTDSAIPASEPEPAARLGIDARISIDDDGSDPPSAIRISQETGGSSFGDFLLLRKHVAPKIALPLFYLGLVAILVLGLVCFVAAICLILTEGLSRTIGLLMLIATGLATPLAVVVWRVFCEMVVAVFGTNAGNTTAPNLRDVES
jgi:hypothetical protein